MCCDGHHQWAIISRSNVVSGVIQYHIEVVLLTKFSVILTDQLSMNDTTLVFFDLNFMQAKIQLRQMSYRGQKKACRTQ